MSIILPTFFRMLNFSLRLLNNLTMALTVLLLTISSIAILYNKVINIGVWLMFVVAFIKIPKITIKTQTETKFHFNTAMLLLTTDTSNMLRQEPLRN